MECNLHLVREFYANWDPRDLDFEVNIRGHVVTFTAHDLNVLFGALEADIDPLRQLNITPPYTDISHLLCENKFVARWTRHKDSGLHLIFP